jgi:NitT/TauT family transport system substrate-binding protein
MSGQIDVGWAGAPFAFDALEKGDIKLLAKASDVESLRNQTSRVIIANAAELGSRKDVFVRYMKAYREALAWMYTDEGTNAYAAWARVSASIAKRALGEFLTAKNLDPDRISGIDDAMVDATSFKYLSAPLSKEQIGKLIELQ